MSDKKIKGLGVLTYPQLCKVIYIKLVKVYEIENQKKPIPIYEFLQKNHITRNCYYRIRDVANGGVDTTYSEMGRLSIKILSSLAEKVGLNFDSMYKLYKEVDHE